MQSNLKSEILNLISLHNNIMYLFCATCVSVAINDAVKPRIKKLYSNANVRNYSAYHRKCVR